mmetsp:Transcript_56067/g.126114  ORF Transcript_56067/g.126114 Transcript_56067/m.126114 type:complete len:239 (+) Transcript_56067:133-849(+)
MMLSAAAQYRLSSISVVHFPAVLSGGDGSRAASAFCNLCFRCIDICRAKTAATSDGAGSPAFSASTMLQSPVPFESVRSMQRSISKLLSATPPASCESNTATTSMVMSSMYESSSPSNLPPRFVFHSVRSAFCLSGGTPYAFIISNTSPHICNTAYSPALWNIFTQDPAPEFPFIVTQGLPSSAFAAAASTISLISSQMLIVPPGKKAGPFRAPSAPPLTPMFRNRKPLASSDSALLI